MLTSSCWLLLTLTGILGGPVPPIPVQNDSMLTDVAVIVTASKPISEQDESKILSVIIQLASELKIGNRTRLAVVMNPYGSFSRLLLPLHKGVRKQLVDNLRLNCTAKLSVQADPQAALDRVADSVFNGKRPVSGDREEAPNFLVLLDVHGTSLDQHRNKAHFVVVLDVEKATAQFGDWSGQSGQVETGQLAKTVVDSVRRAMDSCKFDITVKNCYFANLPWDTKCPCVFDVVVKLRGGGDKRFCPASVSKVLCSDGGLVDCVTKMPPRHAPMWLFLIVFFVVFLPGSCGCFFCVPIGMLICCSDYIEDKLTDKIVFELVEKKLEMLAAGKDPEVEMSIADAETAADGAGQEVEQEVQEEAADDDGVFEDILGRDGKKIGKKKIGKGGKAAKGLSKAKGQLKKGLKGKKPAGGGKLLKAKKKIGLKPKGAQKIGKAFKSGTRKIASKNKMKMSKPMARILLRCMKCAKRCIKFVGK